MNSFDLPCIKQCCESVDPKQGELEVCCLLFYHVVSKHLYVFTGAFIYDKQKMVFPNPYVVIAPLKSMTCQAVCECVGSYVPLILSNLA